MSVDSPVVHQDLVIVMKTFVPTKPCPRSLTAKLSSVLEVYGVLTVEPGFSESTDKTFSFDKHISGNDRSHAPYGTQFSSLAW